MPAVAQTLGWAWGAQMYPASASALRELSEKKSLMYKDSQINSGKGHRTGAASLLGVRDRAQTPTLRAVRVKSTVCSMSLRASAWW